MKREFTAQNAGSLELLLDTICNTFGGILLISLLVAVMLNASSKALENKTTSPESQATLLQAEMKREQVKRELDDLRDHVRQQTSATSSLLPFELIEEAEKYQDAAQRHADLVTLKTTKVGDASQAQIRINDLTRDAAERKAKLEEARRDEAALKKELDEAVAKRSRDAAIPKLTDSMTVPRVYFITKKRLYGPWQTILKLSYGTQVRLNEDDFIESIQNGQNVLRPNPEGGCEIPSTSADLSTLKDKFADFDTTSQHAKILVWPDSYAEFDSVRQVLVQENIKVELIPWAEGKDVTFGQTADFGSSQVQ